MPHTIRLHCVIAAKPEKVFRAFLEPDANAKWLPPDGYTCTVEKMDARVGGSYRMSFRNFTTGQSHAFGGEYLEIKPNERIRWTDRFDDPNLSGDMVTTATFKEVPAGTELNVIQEGVPEIIPESGCYLGWQQSLQNLAKLVEPDIRQ